MTISTLQLSQHRSGGFLTWSLIEHLQRAAGIERKSYILTHDFQAQRGKWSDLTIDHFEIDEMSVDDDGMFCDLDILTRELILDPAGYVSACTHVWSDSAYHPRHKQVLPLFSSCIYIVRDPRDRLVSLAEWQFTEYRRKYGWTDCQNSQEYIEKNLITTSYSWNQHFVSYYRRRQKFNILFVRYEDIIADFVSTANTMANHMELDIPPNKIEEIQSNLSFSKMKKCNPDHLFNGISGLHKLKLSPEQCSVIEAQAKVGMSEMGYL